MNCLDYWCYQVFDPLWLLGCLIPPWLYSCQKSQNDIDIEIIADAIYERISTGITKPVTPELQASLLRYYGYTEETI